MPSEPALLYEKADGIATLTMNRPEVRNALNAEMLCRLVDAWQDVNDDPAVRVAEALEKEMEIGVPVAMSEDAREGTKAFKEKRKPVFQGR